MSTAMKDVVSQISIGRLRPTTRWGSDPFIRLKPLTHIKADFFQAEPTKSSKDKSCKWFVCKSPLTNILGYYSCYFNSS